MEDCWVGGGSSAGSGYGSGRGGASSEDGGAGSGFEAGSGSIGGGAEARIGHNVPRFRCDPVIALCMVM